jgi:Dolichyl-phosphate-mannose-protein mannosyltransferase
VNALLPPTAPQQDPPVGVPALPALRQRRQQGRPWRPLWHPLTAICAAQAVLSLTLVWSNAAFEDEADYLWVGHLEWAHWLHGASWPSAYADRFLSGLPLAYPPLGAVADNIGGLAGARLLSLGFMLAATVLLYLTASRLIGQRGALVGCAIWALSEPALRLAFATYDPLSVLFTALSAWLAVQAAKRRHGGAWVAGAAGALSLANATAYSGIVIDPILIGFAFLVWLPSMRAARALLWALCLAVGCAVVFGLLMTAAGSWPGLLFTVINRTTSDHQSTLLVLNDIWGYSGLIICLAIVGAVFAVGTESRQRGALIALLGCAAFVVPAAQLHDQTGWSLDKHLAYGIWFAAIAAGYACSRLIGWLPRTNWRFTAACCVVALAYPTASSWESAWQVYHSWANTNSFIAAFRPIAGRSQGIVYAATQSHVAAYYIPQVSWTRWTTKLSLNPVSVAPANRESYYSSQLRRGNYGAIALFYSTTFSSAPEMPSTLLLPQSSAATDQALLSLVGEGSGEPGLPALTQALDNDKNYRLARVGSFDTAHGHGIYAIWQKKAQP